jgi:hypothetical protein
MWSNSGLVEFYVECLESEGQQKESESKSDGQDESLEGILL